jgi:protein arginine N-methyltransferase 2
MAEEQQEMGCSPEKIQEILTAAADHDLPAIKKLLNTPGAAQVQDPVTARTPIHAAIASLGSSDPLSPVYKEVPQEDLKRAVDVCKELLQWGGIWNDLDANDETPGCLADRLGRKECYEVVVDAGVRAEVLLGLLGGYEELESEDEEEETEDAEAPELVDAETAQEESEQEGPQERNKAPLPSQPMNDVNSATYLSTPLTFTDNAILDADTNGVMMDWESDIMQVSASILAPSSGLKVLNIGFGMGIIDSFFAATTPSTHHIVEAHPSVLAEVDKPNHKFGKNWEASQPEGRYKIHRGRWQDVLPTLLEAGETYDAIYFDTFAEPYSSLKEFFQSYVPGLLAPGGRFSFFNGLGADRKVCYDVYVKVVEIDACEAGMDVQWMDVEIPQQMMENLEEGGEEWRGVRRRYWTLKEYKLPVLTFME